MRISDWSSDVCASDLFAADQARHQRKAHRLVKPDDAAEEQREREQKLDRNHVERRQHAKHRRLQGREGLAKKRDMDPDRKSVLTGTSVYVSVDLGGRRILTQTTRQQYSIMNNS